MQSKAGGPPDLTPREAAERWISKLRADRKESTLSTYWYRIKRVVDFCEERDLSPLRELTPWGVDGFDVQFREKDPKKVTITHEYRTINDWLEWAETVGIAQEGISDVLEPPELAKKDEVSTDRIEFEVAEANLRALRSQPVKGGLRASRYHALFELMWWTGARIAAIRGLDRRDVDLDEGTVAFIHRPDTGTPIKQAFNPERKIGLPDPAVDALRDYVDHARVSDAYDDFHREPFLTTSQGRTAETTSRRWSKYASLPCQGGECPHERDPDSCDWNRLRGASDCPSSEGPHSVRSGAITNMRNKGWSLDDVAERVNTSPQRIKQHYDHPTLDEQYEQRRSGLVDQLRIDDQPDASDDSNHDE